MRIRIYVVFVFRDHNPFGYSFIEQHTISGFSVLRVIRTGASPVPIVAVYGSLCDICALPEANSRGKRLKLVKHYHILTGFSCLAFITASLIFGKFTFPFYRRYIIIVEFHILCISIFRINEYLFLQAD